MTDSISKAQLLKLIKQGRTIDGRLAEERGAWGHTMNEACEKLGLNRMAFGIVRRLERQDPGQAAHNIRALKLYIDELGLEAQPDLEDLAPVAEGTSNVRRLPARSEAASIDDMLDRSAEATLERLRVSLGETGSLEAARTAVERVIADYPELTDQANELLEQRVATLPAGGEGEAEAAPKRARGRPRKVAAA